MLIEVFEKVDLCGPIEKGDNYYDVSVRKKCLDYLQKNGGYCNLAYNNRNIQSIFLMKELLRSDLFMISPEFWLSLELNEWSPLVVTDAVRILDQIFDQISKNLI